MPGRRKTSNHLKIVQGTAAPRRMNPNELQFEPLTGEVAAPDWLNVHAQKEWRRIVPILQSKGVLSEPDLPALATMCMLYGKMVQSVVAGESVNASLVAQLRLYQAEFGVTPASRSRVPKGKDEKTENPFTRNLRAPA
ncbi:MAG: P27 family phage terminase small subunit [Gammaproteobacteria bacterium]